MAEEGSLLFQVAPNVGDSEEEEEDDILRKQELQKLLSEELQDDLLDTSEEEEDEEEKDEEEVSFVSQGYHEQSVGFSSPFSQPPLHCTNHSYDSPPQTSNFVASDDFSSQGNEPTLPTTVGVSEYKDFNALLAMNIVDNSLPIPDYRKADESNVFHGTSQEYSALAEAKITNGVMGSSDSTAAQQQQLTSSENFFSEFSHLDRQHLEALYIAKDRQVKELESEVKRIIKEDERKFGVLRHQIQLLEEEKRNLLEEQTQLSTELEVLQVRVGEYKGQEEGNKRIKQEREELKEQLLAAQNTISMLSTQLNEMSNTDVLQKIRQNYESALKVSNEEHEKRMEELNNKILSLEEELKQKAQSCEELLQERDSLKCVSSSEEALSVEKEREDEKRRLIAEVEDLTFQLNTLQDQLSTEQDKVAQLQQTLSRTEESQQAMLKERLDEEERLKDALEKLQDELSNQKLIAEANLKSSLEHCRSACLKLHEDSTTRLKEEFLAEKERTESQYRAELNKLRLSTGRDKERQRKEREESLQKQVDAALFTAHKAWKDEEEKRLQLHVQNVLKQMSKDHERKLADAIRKKDVEWTRKSRQLVEDAESCKQKNEMEIARLNKKLVETVSSKLDERGGKLVHEIKSILKSLQAALIELMSQTLIHFEEEKARQIKAARQSALKEAETHYLSCLHALVNSKYSTHMNAAEQ